MTKYLHYLFIAVYSSPNETDEKCKQNFSKKGKDHLIDLDIDERQNCSPKIKVPRQSETQLQVERRGHEK
jgi:hypothetical protein